MNFYLKKSSNSTNYYKWREIIYLSTFVFPRIAIPKCRFVFQQRFKKEISNGFAWILLKTNKFQYRKHLKLQKLQEHEMIIRYFCHRTTLFASRSWRSFLESININLWIAFLLKFLFSQSLAQNWWFTAINLSRM